MRMPAVLVAGLIFATLLTGRAQAQGDGAPAASHPASAETLAPETAPADVAPASVPSSTAVSETTAVTSPAVEAEPATGIAVTLAKVPDAVEEEEGAVPPSDADPIICRTHVETGTIGRRMKVCMKKSEWAAHTRATRKYIGTMQRSRSTQPGGEALGASSGSPGPGRPGG